MLLPPPLRRKSCVGLFRPVGSRMSPRHSCVWRAPPGASAKARFRARSSANRHFIMRRQKVWLNTGFCVPPSLQSRPFLHIHLGFAVTAGDEGLPIVQCPDVYDGFLRHVPADDLPRRVRVQRTDCIPHLLDLAQKLRVQVEMAEENGNPCFGHQGFLSREMGPELRRDRLQRLRQACIFDFGSPSEQPIERFMIPVHQGDAEKGRRHERPRIVGRRLDPLSRKSRPTP